jgi:hypothetical protein
MFRRSLRRSMPTVSALVVVLACMLTGCGIGSDGADADTDAKMPGTSPGSAQVEVPPPGADAQPPSKAPLSAVQAKVLPPRPDIEVPIGEPSELSFEEAREIGLIREGSED